MGVYIKGMEMPKSCRTCPLNSAPPNGCLIWTINDIRKDKRNESCPLIEIDLVRCGECKHFHYDKPYIIQGIPVLGHEVCVFWGDGCKTNPNGFCSYGERRE